MRIIQVKIYKFGELSEKVQQKIVEGWRNNDDYVWGTENEASLKGFTDLFPVSVSNFEYGHQKFINYSIDLNKDEDECDLQGEELWKHLHSNGTFLAIVEDCPFTGYCMDDVIIRPIKDFLKEFDPEATWYSLIDDCLKAWLNACHTDYEDWQSEEAILEDIKNGEHEYTEAGKLVLVPSPVSKGQ